MRHLGLFEGIGGFSLAARWIGWETVAWCEWNEFCQRVLRHHFPDAEGHGDIIKTDFTKYANTIDILTGGFPCQPYSQAGKRLGKEDDRHLWPQMLRAIREVQPRWVVGENVPGLLNWNGGVVLDEIKADLEASGFEVFPPLVLPACGKNAPHRRDRLWIVSYSTGNAKSRQDRKSNRTEIERTPFNEQVNGRQLQTIQHKGLYDLSRITSDTGLQRQEVTEQQPMGSEQLYEGWLTSDTQRIGQQGQGRPKGQSGTKENGDWKASWADPNGRWPTESPFRRRDDGISSKLAKQCLEGLGNAIVPQVAFEIFKTIQQIEQ